MKRALIQGTRICEIADVSFPVAAGLTWVDVPNDTTTQDTYENGAVVKFQPYVPTAMEQWLSDMQASDNLMTRIEEDIIDALDAVTKQRLNQEVMDKYNAKKALRGSKP